MFSIPVNGTLWNITSDGVSIIRLYETRIGGKCKMWLRYYQRPFLHPRCQNNMHKKPITQNHKFTPTINNTYALGHYQYPNSQYTISILPNRARSLIKRTCRTVELRVCLCSLLRAYCICVLHRYDLWYMA